jgi:hypothetical protein
MGFGFVGNLDVNSIAGFSTTRLRKAWTNQSIRTASTRTPVSTGSLSLDESKGATAPLV